VVSRSSSECYAAMMCMGYYLAVTTRVTCNTHSNTDTLSMILHCLPALHHDMVQDHTLINQGGLKTKRANSARSKHSHLNAEHRWRVDSSPFKDALVNFALLDHPKDLRQWSALWLEAL
jgi:hypothetical protein